MPIFAGLRDRACGLAATALRCDVTREAELDALVARVMADCGRLDVMVCNAGGAFTTTYLPDASIDELRRTLAGTGQPAQVTGIASLFGIHFNPRPIKSYRDVVADDAEMTKGLYTGLLNEGILLQTSCFGALGVMTTDAEVDTLVDAVGRVVRRLRE